MIYREGMGRSSQLSRDTGGLALQGGCLAVSVHIYPRVSYSLKCLERLSDKSLWQPYEAALVARSVPERRFWHRFGPPGGPTVSPFRNYKTVLEGLFSEVRQDE